MTRVKVLSLMQPWAQLAVMGLKEYETRPWRTDFRGVLHIHASETYHRGIRLVMSNQHFRDLVREPLTRGAIIGKVELVDIIATSVLRDSLSERERAFGDYTPGRWAWKLTKPLLFDKPIPAKGALSLWNFDMPSERCTQCGNESNRLVTKSAKNVGGTMVQLIGPEERLCPCCASLRGHDSLDEINSRMMRKEVANG